jgi:hypothetical protein
MVISGMIPVLTGSSVALAGISAYFSYCYKNNLNLF